VQDNETPKIRAEQRKDKIRARHRGLCADDVECIPAREQVNFFTDDSPKRVVIYVRVSTDDEKQISSFELQKSHYEDFVRNHPNWELVKIYADEGISGTSLDNRDEFNQMIADCKDKNKKIDLVVVKSVSRFARNLVDCIDTVRKLADLRPPIGVYFEIERIYTLNENSDFQLQHFASFAEHESKHKSTLLKDAYVKRSRYGIVWTPELLGYDLDDDGNLVINAEEAQTIRLIFFMYLYGHTCAEIAEKLMELGLRTNQINRDTGEYNLKWSAGTVLMVLKNERHCGEILTQKTWTPNFRSHKSIKNREDLPQYRKRNHHEPIISREDFIAVQRLIANAKYGNKGILPQLKVVMDGALQGFVSLNPRWAAFQADDYLAASTSAYGEDEQPTQRQAEVAAQSGDFDLRGFEVVRSQFFNTSRAKSITFSTEKFCFGIECLRKLKNILYVEILINPTEQLLAVRPCAKEYRNAVKWAVIEGDEYIPRRQIPGTAFLKTLYKIFGWDKDCKYRVRGVHRQKGDEAVLVFDMRETEIFIPKDAIGAEIRETEKPIVEAKNAVTAYPQEWMYDFGTEHYRLLQAQELATMENDGLGAAGQPYQDELSSKVTAPESLADNIKNIMDDVGQGETVDGN
jgi:DNA invertase Pin-like site-specific DNA recombinase